MIGLRLFIIVFLVSLLLFTCKQAPSDAPPIQTQIAGKVTDGQNNQPIAGIRNHEQVTRNRRNKNIILQKVQYRVKPIYILLTLKNLIVSFYL